MYLLLTTTSFPYYSLGRSMALAQQLGADGLELALTPAMLRQGPERACQLARDQGVPIRALVLPTPSVKFPPEECYPAVARFVAALPDCQVLTLPSPPPGTGLAGLITLLRGYQVALGSAARLLTVANPPARAANGASQFDRFPQLRRVAEEWDLGYTFDTCAAAERNWVITEPLLAMGDRLRNVHLSDYRPSQAHTTELTWPDAQRYQLPGHGTLPLRAFLRTLARRGYTGLLTLTPDPGAVLAWLPPLARRRLVAALAFCRATLDDREPPRLPSPRPEVELPAEAENES